ncbi:MAG: hypothetical protein MUE30_03920 [Spirosomaceae bacterium]|jgi:hypothetical protein|nr:hypothetical protein [Spirosomataceae bacterium]
MSSLIPRRQQRENAKQTLGYRIWSIGFAVFYPIISVFTFVFTALVQLLSGLSQGLVWLLKGGKSIQ